MVLGDSTKAVVGWIIDGDAIYIGGAVQFPLSEMVSNSIDDSKACLSPTHLSI